MNIVVNTVLKAYIDPLSPEEYGALERSLLAEGCRDALVLWGDTLVDGHNRHDICLKHGLPFQTVQNPRFQSMEDVCLWMIDQHLGRRSVSDFQRGMLALRKREILADQLARALATGDHEIPASRDGDAAGPAVDAAPPERLNKREAVAKAARLSSAQVVMIERIHKQAEPEVVAAVRSGAISINAAAAVATLPAADQLAAAAAGADELKQAAKRVREAKRKPQQADAASDGDGESLPALRLRVAELTAENAALRSQLAALQGISAD